MARRTRAFLKWTPEGAPRQTLQFDVVTNEQQEGSSEITEHPVEVGPNVTDHVRSKLNVVTIEGFISNEPLYDTGERGASLRTAQLDVKTYTPPLAPTPGALFSALGGGVSRLFGAVPQQTSVSVLQFDREFDAVAETHEILENLRTTAQLIDLYTTTAEYQNMILERVTLPRDASSGTGGKFQLSFRQIRLVEVKLVTAPVPTEVRGKKAVKKGPKGPEPVKDPVKLKSVARSFLGNIFKP